MPTPVWDASTGTLSNGERVEHFCGKLKILIERFADGRVHNRDVLLDDLYGDDPDRYPNARTLNVHLTLLRQRLKVFGILIENVREHGWRFYQPLARAKQIE